jgi:hypothetical protein
MVADGAPRFCRVTSTTENIYILSPQFSLMPNPQTPFWSPACIGAVIGAVLLIVALAYLVSLPQNQFQPADLLQPKYAADADLGYWMVDKYDPEVDVYHLLVVMQHDNGTFEWLDGDGIWLPRLAATMKYGETMADVIHALIEWVDGEDQPWRR